MSRRVGAHWQKDGEEMSWSAISDQRCRRVIGRNTNQEWVGRSSEPNKLSFRESSKQCISNFRIELSEFVSIPEIMFLVPSLFQGRRHYPGEKLVHIWMGQGLIQQEVGTSVGEIARGYLDELMNRNVVQINDWSIDGRVKNCRLHDLVREVCLRKAKEEIGLEIVKAEGESSSESGFRPRHRVVYGTFSLNQNEHIRSLFLVNVKPGSFYASTKSSYWKKFHLIKTVDLDGFKFRRFPQCFRALLGLKYLRIGSINNVWTFPLILPTWLDHLEQLEVLDLGHGQCVKLPNRTLKMDRLRYFCANPIEGPLRIESWRNIETLKYITQKVWMRCNSSCGARELGIVLDLQSGVDELSRVRDSLEKMENLVSLHLHWYRFDDTASILIPIPNLTNLTQLKLRGEMTKCPDATTFPPNLCGLTLNSTFLGEDPMPQLGKLPKLLHLKLSVITPGGRMRVLHDGFPCLKTLSLHYMPFLTTMDIQQGGMPQLQQLRLRGCPALHTNNLPQHILSLAL